MVNPLPCLAVTDQSMTTLQYLAELNNLDGNYLQMFWAWAQMRSQLTQIKVVVLGAEGV